MVSSLSFRSIHKRAATSVFNEFLSVWFSPLFLPCAVLAFFSSLLVPVSSTKTRFLHSPDIIHLARLFLSLLWYLFLSLFMTKLYQLFNSLPLKTQQDTCAACRSNLRPGLSFLTWLLIPHIQAVFQTQESSGRLSPTIKNYQSLFAKQSQALCIIQTITPLLCSTTYQN